jgi:glycosyltransferase involved in cell wall biosynthesis
MKASEEVTKRKEPGDYLLLFWGYGHAHVGKVHANDMIVVEPGIGSFNKPIAQFCVFESYAVMHYLYGKFEINPKFMDCVIPNYFDLEDFKEPEADLNVEHYPYLKKGKFVLFIGRVILSKGLEIIIESCKDLGLNLIVGGQGNFGAVLHNDFLAKDLDDYLSRPSAFHIGYVEPEQRKELMHKAMCLMCPSLYVEPFGGVNVEAQLCGLPVITSDWGAFSETVDHGITGYRCRTMDHFRWALKNVSSLDKEKIKLRARKNYSLHKVASMYEEYFTMLKQVKFGKGFYEANEGRLGLSWLNKV